MTVSELIAKLSAFNSSATVLIDDYEDPNAEISEMGHIRSIDARDQDDAVIIFSGDAE